MRYVGLNIYVECMRYVDLYIAALYIVHDLMFKEQHFFPVAVAVLRNVQLYSTENRYVAENQSGTVQ